MLRNLFNIKRATLILTGFSALFSIFGIHAQTGSISGTIKLPDNTNAVGAEVQLRSTDFSTTTNANGSFQLAEIPEGTYTLLATLALQYSISRQLQVTANTELMLALTGLVWGFNWFANALHSSSGGEKSLVYTSPVPSLLPEKIP